MVSQDAILAVLHTINDPEMPISIVDLGIIKDIRIEQEPGNDDGGGRRVIVDILPTFVGCPALLVIEDEIRKRVGALRSVSEVQVRMHFDPPWSVDRISDVGREALRQIGITVPDRDDGPKPQQPRCPFCGSSAVHMESAFGPTRCRMIYHCEACRHPFEHLKKLDAPRL